MKLLTHGIRHGDVFWDRLHLFGRRSWKGNKVSRISDSLGVIFSKRRHCTGCSDRHTLLGSRHRVPVSLSRASTIAGQAFEETRQIKRGQGRFPERKAVVVFLLWLGGGAWLDRWRLVRLQR